MLILGDAGTAAVFDVGLADPTPQTRIRDPEIIRDLAGWFLPQPSKLDRALTELRRVGSGHRKHPSRDDHDRLRFDVRIAGGSSRRASAWLSLAAAGVT